MLRAGVPVWFWILCVLWALLVNVHSRSASIHDGAAVKRALSVNREKRDSPHGPKKENYLETCVRQLGLFAFGPFNPSRQYQCEGTSNTSKCIPLRMRCDGEVHCPNGSDELGCGDQNRPGGRTICPSGYIPCREGQCVEADSGFGGVGALCEEYRECSYKYRQVAREFCERFIASDVLRHNLSRYNCDTYFCSGWCLSESSICDGYKSCDDGSDEDHEMCAQRPCDTVKCVKKWSSSDSIACIPSYEMCNGYSTCENGEDEEEEVCQNRTCEEYQFQCGSGRCITDWYVCDNDTDCTDGSDEEEQMCLEKWEKQKLERRGESEESCPKKVSGVNLYSSFLWFEEFGSCEPINKVCSRIRPTRGSIEEVEEALESFESGWLLCANISCQVSNWAFKCVARNIAINRSFEYCLSVESVCDGFADCEDGSDEDPALCRPERPCNPGYFRCGDGTCISDLQVCDGTYHCRNGADEDPEVCNANRECADENLRTCGDSGQCVYEVHFCNQEFDCQNGYDEEAEVCGYFGYTKPACPSGTHPCYTEDADHPTCWPDHDYCSKEYTRNCRMDNSTNECEARVSQCPPGLLPCGDGQCVREDQICSGSLFQCYNGAMSGDEYCAQRLCREGEFSCGLGQCISTTLVCDGVTTDCIRTGADESPQTCEPNYSLTPTAGSSEVSTSSNQHPPPVGLPATTTCEDRTEVCAQLLPLGVCHRHVAFAADLCARSCSLCAPATSSIFRSSSVAGAQKYYNININFL